MLKFRNMTRLDKFKKSMEWSGNQIEELKPEGQYPKKAWRISDRFGNVWNVVFTGNVSEFVISNVPQNSYEKPFSVWIVSSGNEIEIHKADKNGRHIKSDLLLKEFANLAMMVNCYMQLGYLK